MNESQRGSSYAHVLLPSFELTSQKTHFFHDTLAGILPYGNLSIGEYRLPQKMTAGNTATYYKTSPQITPALVFKTAEVVERLASCKTFQVKNKTQIPEIHPEEGIK